MATKKNNDFLSNLTDSIRADIQREIRSSLNLEMRFFREGLRSLLQEMLGGGIGKTSSDLELSRGQSGVDILSLLTHAKRDT